MPQIENSFANKDALSSEKHAPLELEGNLGNQVHGWGGVPLGWMVAGPEQFRSDRWAHSDKCEHESRAVTLK